ncbi:MAG: GTP-binding protein [Planctomycetota bacterium]
MLLIPRKLGWLLIAYVALIAYATVTWLPSAVDAYEGLAERSPRLGMAYLALVGAGASVLFGLSLWLFLRLWRNTANKQAHAHRRGQNPSQMSSRDQQQELSDNLGTSRDFAHDASVSSDLRIEIDQALIDLESKQQSARLEIVAFGTISSGKSTLLNALAGRQVFASDVVGGTTTMRSEIPWPGSDQVVLVDTPGLAEVRGESRAAEAAQAAKNSDLVLLVVDGPLKAYEVDLVRKLTEMEKRLVVCLNKEDWYSDQEQAQLIGQIADQLPSIVAEDIVAVRAGEVSRVRVRVAADGSEVEEDYQLPPSVQALAERLLQVVERDGSELLLANLLLQSRGLVDEAKARVRAVLDQRADAIISKHMWAAGGAAGINPIPLLDIAGGSAITVKMVLELARVYKQSIDADTVVKMLEQLGKNLIAMVGVTAATPALASGIGSLLKTVPGIGTIAGGVVQGTVQALVTRWIGNVFQKYFQQEMKAPAGGFAELARDQWHQLTQPESLRKLVQVGRRELSRNSDRKGSDD